MKFEGSEIRFRKLDEEGRPTGEETTILGHVTMGEAADAVDAPDVVVPAGDGIYIAPEPREFTVEWTLTEPKEIFDLRVALGHGAYRLRGDELGHGVEDVWACDLPPLPPSFERLSLLWGSEPVRWSLLVDPPVWRMPDDAGLTFSYRRWLPPFWFPTVVPFYRETRLALESREMQLRRDYRVAALGWAADALAEHGHVMDVDAVVEGMLMASELARTVLLGILGIGE